MRRDNAVYASDTWNRCRNREGEGERNAEFRSMRSDEIRSREAINLILNDDFAREKKERKREDFQKMEILSFLCRFVLLKCNYVSLI